MHEFAVQSTVCPGLLIISLLSAVSLKGRLAKDELSHASRKNEISTLRANSMS